MAIPFNLPTDEETEENYRRLDQLLLDLYDVLRQILLRRRIQRGVVRPEGQHHQHHPSHHNHYHHPQGGSGNPSQEVASPEQGGQQLPDLVPGCHHAPALTRKPPVPPPRRRRRRPASDGKQQVQQGPSPPAELLQQGPSWLNVGIELRQIAEEFRSSRTDGKEEKSRKEIKASSLFSLLVPAPLTGSIWTTVIILVGWRILAARHR